MRAGRRLLIACAAMGLLLSSVACGCGVPSAIREGLKVNWPLTIARGSGDVVEEERDLSGFSSVALRGIGQLHIEQGGTESVWIEAEDNLLPYLETRVEGTKLIVGTKPGAFIRPTQPIVFRVTLVDLDRLEISGSGDVEAEDIETEDLSLSVSGSGELVLSDLRADGIDARISGSGTVDVSGSANIQEIRISGSGDYRARELATAEADVRISGSGNAILDVSSRLAIKVTGSGTVSYSGSPEVETSVTGSGSVTRLGD